MSSRLLGWGLLAPILLINCAGAKEDRAMRYAAKAFYKQSGLERKVSKKIDKNIPKDVQQFGVYCGKAIQIATERKVYFEIEF